MIDKTGQETTFTPGQQVTWYYQAAGGYGYIIPVNGLVTKVSPTRVKILVTTVTGLERELWVYPHNLEGR